MKGQSEINWYFIKTKDNPISKLGFGVSAWSEEDALQLLKQTVFNGEDIPKIIEIQTIKSLDELEQNHVRPNIGSPTHRGVWFPNY
ncbi:hypothetical protein K6119_04165 [Paracrocinitomix mangrovi]|uniref:hypothetical protein n=1 Tax=Paracrocinitomix mangrovi TaxID=2862509 RepID=UPI001C8D6BAE|nr:hypothetical protein [Paracrocinitomix mangrovi]UKN02708.1 hypothetical protein K6119_04165 [Paracrocinitomix mangrovi]